MPDVRATPGQGLGRDKAVLGWEEDRGTDHRVPHPSHLPPWSHPAELPAVMGVEQPPRGPDGF